MTFEPTPSARLHLNREPGRFTLPDWLRDAATEAKPAIASMDAAVQAVADAAQVERAALAGYHEKSVMGKDELVAVEDIGIDDWRRLRHRATAAEREHQRADHARRRAWMAMCDVLATDPGALAAADALSDQSHGRVVELIEELKQAIADFRAVDRFVPRRQQDSPEGASVIMWANRSTPAIGALEEEFTHRKPSDWA
ncbi:MAG: hypothetical protein K0S65_788 [Labilithrix sp.]|jgi:hypothetical protein|nr:hypothetical protein [Labilithrix sp.]